MHDGSYIITSIRKASELKVSPDNFIYPVYNNMQKINAKSFGVLKKSLGFTAPPVNTGSTLNIPEPSTKLSTIPESFIEETIEEVPIVAKKRTVPKKPLTGSKGMEGGKRKTRRSKKHGSKTHKGRK